MDTLRKSWRRAWAAIGASGDGNALMTRLLACYSEPHRKYHTLQHLTECISNLESALALASHPGELEMALWFHDAVYDVQAQDNELKSAIWAENALLEANLPADSARRVRGLVLATCHTVIPQTLDGQLLVDVDLSILGAPPARFAEYERQVRQEYALVPTPVFREKRRAVLQHFLARQHIYNTPHFRGGLEVRARENLQHSISRLEGQAPVP